MQMTSVSFWFRVVSIRIAVLPVERSPMISSRWPRPTFVIASIALIPVMSGSFTGWRSTTPGALNSSGRVSEVSIGGPPSSGLPSGSTMRPISASPTGTLATWPVRLTGSPSPTCSHSPKSAAPTLSSSRLNAMPVTPCSRSTISIATTFSSPWMRAIPSPTWRTDPTSARSVSTSYCSIRSLRIEVISSGRSFKCAPSGAGQLSSQSFEAAAHAGVREIRAGAQDEAADQGRIDLAARAKPAAGNLFDLLEEPLGLLVGQLHGSCQLDVEDALLGGDEGLELAVDLVELVHTTLLDDEEQEVPHELVGVGEDRAERLPFLAGLDFWVLEQRAQLRHLPHGLDERMEIVADGLQAILLLGRLEERVRIGSFGDRH